MLDRADNSANPRQLPTEGALAPSTTQPEADPTPIPAALSQSTETDDPLYSIRVAENPGTLCTACGKQETGSGPVGYLDDAQICDLCLLEASTDLGLLLAHAAVARAYAETGGTVEEPQALTELGVFARIYHRIASKSWPARIFRIPGFAAANDTTH